MRADAPVSGWLVLALEALLWTIIAASLVAYHRQQSKAPLLTSVRWSAAVIGFALACGALGWLVMP